MSPNRRQMLQATAALAGGASAISKSLQADPPDAPAGQPNWAAVRQDFPWLAKRLWLTAADYHPIGAHSLRAMENYSAYRAYGPGEGRSGFRQEAETKELYAKPSEIAFVQSTTDGENIVVAGMRLGETKGNVVIDDLVAKVNKAFGGETIAFRRWEFTEPSGDLTIVGGMRISPSVYNNQDDIDKLLNALS